MAVDVVQDVLHVSVVTLVGVFDSIPYRALNSSFCSKFSLFGHVSSTDQLDAEVEAHDLGEFDLVRYNFGHPLEVALIPVHNGVFVSLI